MAPHNSRGRLAIEVCWNVMIKSHKSVSSSYVEITWQLAYWLT